MNTKNLRTYLPVPDRPSYSDAKAECLSHLEKWMCAPPCALPPRDDFSCEEHWLNTCRTLLKLRDIEAALTEDEEFRRSHPFSGLPLEEECGLYYDEDSDDFDMLCHATVARRWWRHGALLGTANPLKVACESPEFDRDFSVAQLATALRMPYHDAEGVVLRWNLLGWVIDAGQCKWSKTEYFDKFWYDGDQWPPSSVIERLMASHLARREAELRAEAAREAGRRRIALLEAEAAWQTWMEEEAAEKALAAAVVAWHRSIRARLARRFGAA